jgi:hypothetical protein
VWAILAANVISLLVIWTSIKAITLPGFIFIVNLTEGLKPFRWLRKFSSHSETCGYSSLDFCPNWIPIRFKEVTNSKRSLWHDRFLIDLRFSWRWLWRMAPSGMLCHVALVWTDVSEELSASFIRVTRIGELGTTLVVTSNQCTLHRH